MSTSMVTTVLDIEREAEALLTQARQEADAAIAEAEKTRAETAKAAEEAVRQEISRVEAAAREERDKKSRELTAAGDAALSAVRNISDAAFDGGVRHIMNLLSGS